MLLLWLLLLFRYFTPCLCWCYILLFFMPLSLYCLMPICFMMIMRWYIIQPLLLTIFMILMPVVLLELIIDATFVIFACYAMMPIPYSLISSLCLIFDGADADTIYFTRFCHSIVLMHSVRLLLHAIITHLYYYAMLFFDIACLMLFISPTLYAFQSIPAPYAHFMLLLSSYYLCRWRYADLLLFDALCALVHKSARSPACLIRYAVISFDIVFECCFDISLFPLMMLARQPLSAISRYAASSAWLCFFPLRFLPSYWAHFLFWYFRYYDIYATLFCCWWYDALILLPAPAVPMPEAYDAADIPDYFRSYFDTLFIMLTLCFMFDIFFPPLRHYNFAIACLICLDFDVDAYTAFRYKMRTPLSLIIDDVLLYLLCLLDAVWCQSARAPIAFMFYFILLFFLLCFMFAVDMLAFLLLRFTIVLLIIATIDISFAAYLFCRYLICCWLLPTIATAFRYGFADYADFFFFFYLFFRCLFTYGTLLITRPYAAGDAVTCLRATPRCWWRCSKQRRHDASYAPPYILPLLRHAAASADTPLRYVTRYSHISPRRQLIRYFDATSLISPDTTFRSSPSSIDAADALFLSCSFARFTLRWGFHFCSFFAFDVLIISRLRLLIADIFFRHAHCCLSRYSCLSLISFIVLFFPLVSLSSMSIIMPPFSDISLLIDAHIFSLFRRFAFTLNIFHCFCFLYFFMLFFIDVISRRLAITACLCFDFRLMLMFRLIWYTCWCLRCWWCWLFHVSIRLHYHYFDIFLAADIDYRHYDCRRHASPAMLIISDDCPDVDGFDGAAARFLSLFDFPCLFAVLLSPFATFAVFAFQVFAVSPAAWFFELFAYAIIFSHFFRFSLPFRCCHYWSFFFAISAVWCHFSMFRHTFHALIFFRCSIDIFLLHAWCYPYVRYSLHSLPPLMFAPRHARCLILFRLLMLMLSPTFSPPPCLLCLFVALWRLLTTADIATLMLLLLFAMFAIFAIFAAYFAYYLMLPSYAMPARYMLELRPLFGAIFAAYVRSPALLFTLFWCCRYGARLSSYFSRRHDMRVLRCSAIRHRADAMRHAAEFDVSSRYFVWCLMMLLYAARVDATRHLCLLYYLYGAHFAWLHALFCAIYYSFATIWLFWYVDIIYYVAIDVSLMLIIFMRLSPQERLILPAVYASSLICYSMLLLPCYDAREAHTRRCCARVCHTAAWLQRYSPLDMRYASICSYAIWYVDACLWHLPALIACYACFWPLRSVADAPVPCSYVYMQNDYLFKITLAARYAAAYAKCVPCDMPSFIAYSALSSALRCCRRHCYPLVFIYVMLRDATWRAARYDATIALWRL